jgi:hypothetical protein
MVNVNLKFANDLDLLIIVSQASVIIKLREVRNSYKVELVIPGNSRNFSFDKRNKTVNGKVMIFRSAASGSSNLAFVNGTSFKSVIII